LNGVATDEHVLVGSAYTNSKYTSYYSYDPAKAKKLLSDAGFPNGFDMGDIATLAGYADVAQAVQSQLAAVGIRGTLRPLDSGPALISLCFTSQKFPMFVGGVILRLDPTVTCEELYLPDALQNMGRTAPPDVLSKLKLAEQPTSDAEHRARAQDLIGQLVIDAPNQIIGTPAFYILYASQVGSMKSIWDSPNNFPDYGQVVKSK
jgi:peptide/nickel transport system substrate-binding protein